MADKATKTATDTLFVYVIVRFMSLRLIAYSDNPTGAAGALTGKDSALGGLGGGRKPGPGNRGDNEGAVSTVGLHKIRYTDPSTGLQRRGGEELAEDSYPARSRR